MGKGLLQRHNHKVLRLLIHWYCGNKDVVNSNPSQKGTDNTYFLFEMAKMIWDNIVVSYYDICKVGQSWCRNGLLYYCIFYYTVLQCLTNTKIFVHQANYDYVSNTLLHYALQWIYPCLNNILQLF